MIAFFHKWLKKYLFQVSEEDCIAGALNHYAVLYVVDPQVPAGRNRLPLSRLMV